MKNQWIKINTHFFGKKHCEDLNLNLRKGKFDAVGKNFT